MAQLNSLIVTGDSRFLNTINGNITTTNGIHRATMETSSTATAFVLTADGIDSLYDGLIITCKNTKIASASGCTINLNGLGAKSIWLSQNNSACTTHWGLNHTYFFIYDGANSRWELQQGRDTDGNDTSTLHSYYSRPTVDTNGIKQYSLFAYTSSKKVSSFTTNNGTGTKTFNTTTLFDIRKIFYYNGSGNVAAGAKLGNNTMSLNENLVDMRYTFNGVTTDASTSSLVAEKPVYICFDLNEMISSNLANTSCLAKLKSPYIAQEMNDMGTLYVLVGYMHDSYRCSLVMDNLTYAYGPAGYNCFTISDVSNYSVSAINAGTVNGHTVDKDVPSNAVFTDHTYTGTGLISVNASTGVISTTATANTGTITSVKTTAGAHTTINVTSGAANFNVPTKTSHLTNDSGFVTSDTKVSQVLDSSNQNRPLIMAGTTISDTNSSMTGTVARNNNIYANPYTGDIYTGASNGITNDNKLITGADFHNNYATDSDTDTLYHMVFKKQSTSDSDINDELYETVLQDRIHEKLSYNPFTQTLFAGNYNGFRMGGLLVYQAATKNFGFRLPTASSKDMATSGLLFFNHGIYWFDIAVASDGSRVSSYSITKIAGTINNITANVSHVTDSLLGECWQIQYSFANGGSLWTQVKYMLCEYRGAERTRHLHFYIINSNNTYVFEDDHRYDNYQ